MFLPMLGHKKADGVERLGLGGFRFFVQTFEDRRHHGALYRKENHGRMAYLISTSLRR